MIKILSVVLAAFFACAGALASGLEWHGRGSGGEKIYMIAHHEDGLWQLEIFSVAPGKLQERTGYFAAASEEALMALADGVAGVELLMRDAGQNDAAVVTTELSGRYLWKVRGDWNEEWEKRYAGWVQSTINTDFFTDHNIATNCADLVIAARWIFSRINGLPAGNFLHGSRVYFTQDSFKEKWKKLPTHEEWNKDALFLAALDYLLENSGVITLMKDSYPIAINRESVLPGAFIMYQTDTDNHSRLVAAVDTSDMFGLGSGMPVWTIESTSPRIVRKVFFGSYWDIDQPKYGQGGFMRTRWPVLRGGKWQPKSAKEMPWYSREQFEKGFVPPGEIFSLSVARAINPDFKLRRVYDQGFEQYSKLVYRRAALVEEGFKACDGAGSSCRPGSYLYENWSTPERDMKMLKMLLILQNLRGRFEAEDGLEKSRRDWLYNMEDHGFTVYSGKRFSLGAVSSALLSGSVSSDPRASLPKRWGLESRLLYPKFRETFRKTMDGWTALVRPPMKLRVLAELALGHCNYVPEEECKAFNLMALDDRIEYSGKTQSLLDWAKEVLKISPCMQRIVMAY
ncbi:MAG: hypothetical protein A2583_00470 [Bdellovibrionales bacterium RIFOXYD1_FULL_53_11]|nr:MAG: hypothetical protein A2583_00470 [Bdellovibrionales bacterium RIFOXYD1_FULL_53_11]